MHRFRGEIVSLRLIRVEIVSMRLIEAATLTVRIIERASFLIVIVLRFGTTVCVRLLQIILAIFRTVRTVRTTTIRRVCCFSRLRTITCNVTRLATIVTYAISRRLVCRIVLPRVRILIIGLRTSRLAVSLVLCTALLFTSLWTVLTDVTELLAIVAPLIRVLIVAIRRRFARRIVVTAFLVLTTRFIRLVVRARCCHIVMRITNATEYTRLARFELLST